MVRNKKLSVLTLSLLSTLSFAVYAQNTNDHIVVAPHCLIQNLGTPVETLASNQDFALIAVNEAGIDQLITAKTRHSVQPCGGFRDVTAAWKTIHGAKFSNTDAAKAFLEKEITPEKNILIDKKTNYKIQYRKAVNALLKQITPDNMWNNLTTLSHFPDRYAGSDNGVKAAAWLKTQVETIAKENNRDDVTTYYVATGSYKQPSLVVKIGASDEAGIVIGGHMDTLSSAWELKPGADDDGSGTVTVLEVARTLLASGMHFKKPIYIIWYSAEEEGLIGSSYVVSDFKKKNIPVDAVLQLDMTGYAYQNDPTIWLINDNVSTDLTTYLKQLIKQYVKTPVGDTKCGYSCSDHASWNLKGYTASFPFEAKFGTEDPDIHTSRDTMESLSLNHMTNFAKLGTAFAVELAEPLS